MIYVKITNFFDSFGQPDYKGLTISQIVAGSQLYPVDDSDSTAYFATNEEVTEATDLIIIDEATYTQAKTDRKTTETTLEQRITDLETENTSLGTQLFALQTELLSLGVLS